MKRREEGFTAIELVIALAITGIVIVVMTMTIAIILNNYQRSTYHNIVLDQVQNAGFWISHDVGMAKNVSFDDPSGFPLTLVIPIDTDEVNDLSVVYSIDSDKLKRQVYNSSQTLIAETFVAEYIVEDTTFSTPGSNIYNLTVKGSKGEVVVERCYKVSQRLNAN